MVNVTRVRGILLDIEGTTTPIDFVHQVLFSYARSHVKTFLQRNWDSAEVVADLKDLRKDHEFDVEQSQNPPLLATGSRNAQLDSFIAYINWLIDRDRKSRPLKSLQGKIWMQGYRDGTLKSKVFTDVVPALERWSQAGRTINIFSSGSVLAQKLLFEHTESGNLTPFINNYFDTTTGAKADPDSYRRIAAALELSPAEILFVSDVVGEIEAAHCVGMQTALCVRPGNEPQNSADRYQIIHSFAEISLGEDKSGVSSLKN
ncbi:MAG TPA: acireductone synthase [Pyrinomonadaceae bacterium]|nr:acireductone synthase [Pyrinomonadaceae bacterium]